MYQGYRNCLGTSKLVTCPGPDHLPAGAFAGLSRALLGWTSGLGTHAHVDSLCFCSLRPGEKAAWWAQAWASLTPDPHSVSLEPLALVASPTLIISTSENHELVCPVIRGQAMTFEVCRLG